MPLCLVVVRYHRQVVGNDSTERKYIQEMTIGEMNTMFSTIGVQGTKNTSIDGEGIQIW